MKATKVNKVNQGTYFNLQDTETAPVWVRGEYIREAGKYSCFKFDDTNHEKLMKGIEKKKERDAGVRYIPVQMAIMSHLSDVQELIQMGAEGRLRANNHINFAKQLVLTYPDTSIEVSENELNELWKKTIN